MLNITILFNSLLVFLIVLEQLLELPALLQAGGRMHPLILHFPIVLIVLYALYSLFIRQSKKDNASFEYYADRLLLLAALTASITALAGLFLSREEGYDAEALSIHKWTGVAISLYSLGWYVWKNFIKKRKITRWLISLIAVAGISVVGHEGAAITHGTDFLWEPIQKKNDTPPIPLKDAVVYTDIISPIIETKCANCHNPKKAKGDLILTSPEDILKAGKNGALWSTHDEESLLLKRLYLPEGDKKHMPPKGKPQLSQEEIALIRLWVQKGGSFDMKLIDLPETDTLYQLASVHFVSDKEEVYSFDAADPELIQSLQSENRIVSQLAINSPALNVSFFNASQFKTEQLKELSKIKQQIVSLDLSRMPLSKEDLKIVSEMEQLRKLNLSFSTIKADDLEVLNTLKKLQSVSFAGTQVKASQLSLISQWPSLKQLYVWKLAGSEKDWQDLQAKNPSVTIDKGFVADSIMMRLTPPIFDHEETIIAEPTALRLKQFIQGVEIRYTLDGTEPDSINSPIYTGKELIDRSATIKAKSYKQGWISSEILEANLFRKTYTPDTIQFITAPEKDYSGSPKKLYDDIKGDFNFKSGSWLAWREQPMEVLVTLRKEETVKSVTLSVMKNIPAYVTVPSRIEVWGGAQQDNMQLLSTLQPKRSKCFTCF